MLYIARNGSNRSMNTGFVLGARVPAQVTAAGMLMLAMGDKAFLEHWLAATVLKAYTSHSITSKERFLVEFARIRANGWAISEHSWN